MQKATKGRPKHNQKQILATLHYEHHAYIVPKQALLNQPNVILSLRVMSGQERIKAWREAPRR